MVRRRMEFVAAAIAVIMAAGCGGSAPEARTVQGACADVYGGNVCTWADLDGAGVVTAFGATVPLAAIEGAPDEMEMVFPPVASAAVALPAEVTAANGLDHLTVYWEAHGHPPGPYLTPHFDFHFYNIPSATRAAIDCVDLTKPTALPAGYELVDVEIPEIGMLEGLCVPGMGMHGLLASELASDQLFHGTMVIGYNAGAPIFVEPMITRDMLLKRQSFDLPVPAVPGLPDGVRYPQRFRAEYQADTDTYRFTFSGI